MHATMCDVTADFFQSTTFFLDCGRCGFRNTTFIAQLRELNYLIFLLEESLKDEEGIDDVKVTFIGDSSRFQIEIC